ncbi:uncharacterized protein Fot_21760 [Forsythia ovata]|uniref:Uncharacterized protein n=1 Tax=Forsythia ovata TaxID=205694 RepID=A0ABD1UVW9_9LAMI
MRQQKGKEVASLSEAVEFGGGRESVSPRTHRVNLGLNHKEMDLVEDWVEHVRELSGGHEDPDFVPEYWACNLYPSELNVLDFTKLRDHYRVLERVRLIFPNKKDRPWSPPEGHVTIMSDAFACGIRLSLHPFFRAILMSYNVYPYQEFPNFWTQAVGTWLVWQEVNPDYDMPLYNFNTLFKLNKCARRDEEPKEGVKDWYYLTPREIYSLVITGHPSSIKHWRIQWL